MRKGGGKNEYYRRDKLRIFEESQKIIVFEEELRVTKEKRFDKDLQFLCSRMTIEGNYMRCLLARNELHKFIDVSFRNIYKF